MALLTTTPQIQLSGSHLSTLWSSLRHLTAAGKSGASSFGELTRATGETEVTNSQSADKSSVPSCAALLNHIELDPVTLHVVKIHNRPTLKPHWRESHRSHDSFYKNILGEGHTFDFKVHEVCSAVLGSRSLRFSVSLANDIMYRQIRGFKTKRSTATGISGATRIGRIVPMKIPVTGSLSETERLEMALSNSDAEGLPGLSKFLSNMSLSEEEEQMVKVSFADGFHAGTDWRSMSKGLNNTQGSLIRTRAFFEGYKCHSAATMKRDGSSQSWYAKLTGWTWRLATTTLLITALVVIASRYVSIKSVKLLNREDFEVSPESVNVTFDDVRGLAEAKAELSNIVDFLKNPSKYTDLGAKLPNGCLLVGEPGVGKTLLAKAVAGEAGVPFFQASGAEFDEVYVGTGAKRVRQLFQAAKDKAPCVIFIDEIDSVGSKRTSSELHPYANQTVNQLLTEMDGFVGNPGVIVLGATNKKQNLDKALLRPGRFDVEVTINVPDLSERKEILDLYLPKIVTDGKVDVHTVAKQTTGCTGADLYNICNHAAMKAATDGQTVVTMKHMEYALDKVRMGPQKKRIATEKVNRCTAYHEAGHAILLYYSKNSQAKLHKITILPRGMSLGMTHYINDDARELQYSKEDMLEDLDVCMGGRIAEEMTLGVEKVTTGGSSDMAKASKIASAMVQQFGFSDKVGIRYLSGDDTLSEKLKQEMDEEVARILQESYERAKRLLQSRHKEMKLLAEALLEYEELTFEEAKIVIEGGKLNKIPYSTEHGSKPSKGGPASGDESKVTPNILKPVKL